MAPKGALQLRARQVSLFMAITLVPVYFFAEWLGNFGSRFAALWLFVTVILGWLSMEPSSATYEKPFFLGRGWSRFFARRNSDPRRQTALILSLREHPGYIDGRAYTDKDLSAIPSDTVYLDLYQAPITDDGIKALPSLPYLRCLDLDETQITDAALTLISQFKTLEELWLEGTSVTDAGLQSLQVLTNLKFMSLAYTDVSSSAAEKLILVIPELEVGF